MATITTTGTLPVPLDFAFSLHADPRRWPEWVHGMKEVTRIEGDSGVGTVVGTRNKVAGLIVPLDVTVVECTCGDTDGLWGADLRGALVYGHERWSFHAQGAETSVQWSFEYHAKGGPVGRLLERLLLDKAMDRLTAESSSNLQLLSRREFAH